MIEELQLIYGDPRENYRVLLRNDIVYAHRQTGDLKLQLMGPNAKRTGRTYPAVVFLNAGGFLRPNMFEELPQLVDLARRGYMIASVEHRGVDRDGIVQDHAQYPDSIADAKEAVRFLRKHAEEYGIDPSFIAMMGLAPGGWISLLAGFTAGDPFFDQGELLEVSSEIQAVVDIYGQTNYMTMAEDRMALPNYTARDVLEGKYLIEMSRFFGEPNPNYEYHMKRTSPIGYVEDNKPLPPVLIIHDEFNHVIPYAQSERLFQRLKEMGHRAEMVKVVGASWLKGLWTKELVDRIVLFLDSCR